MQRKVKKSWKKKIRKHFKVGNPKNEIKIYCVHRFSKIFYFKSHHIASFGSKRRHSKLNMCNHQAIFYINKADCHKTHALSNQRRTDQLTDQSTDKATKMQNILRRTFSKKNKFGSFAFPNLRFFENSKRSVAINIQEQALYRTLLSDSQISLHYLCWNRNKTVSGQQCVRHFAEIEKRGWENWRGLRASKKGVRASQINLRASQGGRTNIWSEP